MYVEACLPTYLPGQTAAHSSTIYMAMSYIPSVSTTVHAMVFTVTSQCMHHMRLKSSDAADE